MKKPWCVVLVFAFLLWESPANASIRLLPNSSPNATVRLQLVGENIPGAVIDGISEGAGAWNNGGCNSGGNDFPRFFSSGNHDVTIQVEYNQGVSPERSTGGSTFCARSDPSMTGNSTTFRLYSQVELAGVGTFDCFPDSAIAADTIAHELGHYLGLNHPTCSGQDIMGPREGDVVAGQMTWCTSRSVKSWECEAADFQNPTPNEYEEECENQIIECVPTEPSPILVDLDRRGFHLSGLESPVAFDIDNDGNREMLGWPWPDSFDGILALDRNRNGRIDNGSELFGNATPLLSGLPAEHGYFALAELDSHSLGGDGNKRIDRSDASFFLLTIWLDWNRNGMSEPWELFSLSDLGVVGLSVDFKKSDSVDEHGNRFPFFSTSWLDISGRGILPAETVDVFFVVEEESFAE